MIIISDMLSRCDQFHDKNMIIGNHLNLSFNPKLESYGKNSTVKNMQIAIS